MNGSDPDDVLFNALIYTPLTIALCKTNCCHFKYFMSSYFWLNCFLTAITVPNTNRSKLTSLMFSHYSRTSSETLLVLIILRTYLEYILKKKKEREKRKILHILYLNNINMFTDDYSNSKMVNVMNVL